MTPEQKSWKSRLEKLGVTQKSFAVMLNLDYSTLNRYITCENEPTATRFNLIKDKIEKLEKLF